MSITLRARFSHAWLQCTDCQQRWSLDEVTSNRAGFEHPCAELASEFEAQQIAYRASLRAGKAEKEASA
jgi:hypothetical protein